MAKKYVKDTGCCKRFDPKPWNGKTVVFKNRLFLKDHVHSFFHIPLTMNRVMKRDMEKIWAAKAQNDEALMLFDENSLWGSDIYIAVKKEVPDSQMVRISGTFLSKVYSGGYNETGNWVKDMHAYVKKKGKKMKKLYFFYTMCPSCAKAYGQNYTVLLAQV